MTSPPPVVHIHYLRPPDRKEIFTQHLILDTPEVKVTLARAVSFDPPIVIHGEVALETGSDAVWFTFPGLWHDIGLFHRADGSYTGLYANILTPPRFFRGGVWETTDLFLDVWVDPQGRLSVLDENQLVEALGRSEISQDLADRARQEAARIEREFSAGRWPPAVVEEWTLDRARSHFSAVEIQAAARRPRSR